MGIYCCVKQALNHNLKYVSVDASGCYGYNYIPENIYNSNNLSNEMYLDNKNKQIPTRFQKYKNSEDDILLENTILIKTDDFLNTFVSDMKVPDTRRGEYVSTKCKIENVDNKWVCNPTQKQEDGVISNKMKNKKGNYQMFDDLLKALFSSN